MSRIVTWLLSYAPAVAVAAWLLDGISFTGASAPFADQVRDKILPLLVVAVILGLVSAVVKPVVKLLSIPFIIITLGLFLLVINALMLELTAWVVGQAGLGFRVDGFWTAVAGGIVITLVTGAVDLVTAEEDR